jgi:hypothetical protein
MERLHTLDLVVIKDAIQTYQQIPDFIINMAGKVPSLRKLGFKGGKNHNKFVDMFGEKYPHKQLLVSQIRYAIVSFH